ncbi:MAG: secretin N-terminal domain-containing protein [Bdellovibrionota bacterium]
MKKIAMLSACFFSLSTAIAAPAFAQDAFSAKCPDIPACASAVSQITGDHYLFTDDVKGKLNSTTSTPFTAQNAELLFTLMLDQNGYTRVASGAPRTYIIMRQRDAKDSHLPQVYASSSQTPELPNTWDYVDLVFKLKNAEAGSDIARIMRNFMPPNSRIIADEPNGRVLVTAAAPVLKRVYALIKDADKPLNATQRKAKINRERELEQKMREKSKEKAE